MATKHLRKDKLSIHFTEAQMNLRLSYRSNIQAMGYQETVGYDSIRTLWTALSKQEINPSLLVLCLDIEDGLAASMVTAIREREIGKNPFVPIILSSWTLGEDGFGKALSVGADGYMIKPASANDLSRYMEAYLRKRPPFVGVRKYVGPDRRRDNKDRSGIALTVNPPNVPEMLVDFATPVDVQKAIDDTWMKLCVARSKGAAFEAGVTARMIAQSFEKCSFTEKDLGKLRDIMEAIELAITYLSPETYAGTVDLLNQLSEISEQILSEKENSPKTLVKLLTPLASAVCLSVRPDMGNEVVEKEIAGWITRYKTHSEKQVA